MSYFFNALIVLVTFIATEGIAWALHKYIMHGAMWFLHESHHVKEEGHFFEKNDLFLLFFAVPSALCIYFGMVAGMDYRLYIGIGILIYGIVYFLVHDVFIHQRYPPLLRKSAYSYFRALRRAHHAHHKHTGKEDGEAFGLLWASKKYFEKKSA
jgi:beta-carotene 3-hydroxylase